MKKVLYGLLLVVVLGLLCAGTSLAAPVGPAGEGFSIFADSENGYYDSTSVGAGYGIGDNLTIGAFYLLDWEDFGVYANLAFGPVSLNGELVFEDYCNDGFFSALYIFDLDPIALGVGIGSYYCEDVGLDKLGLVVTAEFKLDPLVVFGQYYYVPDGPDPTFKIGASFTF